MIASDSKKWGEVIKRAGIKFDEATPAFPRHRTRPILGHGERPEAARSGQAFEKRPGQADPRQGVAAGHAADRSDAGRSAQSRHRQGARRHRLADRSPSPHGGGDAQASKLAPPPDNSLDRRADFANAHRARKSTPAGVRRAAADAATSAKGPADLDPELAKALGYGGSDPSKPLIGRTEMNRRPAATATKFPTSPSRGARSATGRRRSR